MVFLAPKPVEKIPEEHRWIWHCGDVVENPARVKSVVEENLENPKKYEKERINALHNIFHDFDGKSADRFKELVQKLVDGN